MRKIKYAICSILFAWLFTACTKDTNSGGGPPPPPPFDSIISGYSPTDRYGNAIATPDPTDWRTDDRWSQEEMNLFGGGNYNTYCTFHDSDLHAAGYPNPTHDIFNCAFFMNRGHFDNSTKVEVLLVNQHWQKLTSVLKVNSTFAISLNTSDTIPTDTIFRLMYRITDKNNCVRMGHGDILRK